MRDLKKVEYAKFTGVCWSGAEQCVSCEYVFSLLRNCCGDAWNQLEGNVYLAIHFLYLGTYPAILFSISLA